jgi:ADP-dependent NAD(P)H-hydrate dehydratase / NAD(P)H-hydrate epimerase
VGRTSEFDHAYDGAMRAVINPRQMRVIDAEALSGGLSLDVLVHRAGEAVARVARRMMGGVYGRTVVLVVGKGNNGADGRIAGRLLADRGVRVHVIEADRMPLRLPLCDLIIDAAYGTGFRGDWNPPSTRGIPVLAVDIPSGLDGLTGRAGPHVWKADRTLTFVALKPGLLFGQGPALSGEVEVADIGLGLGLGSIDTNQVEESDVATWLPRRAVAAHKWNAAVYVLAGSATMMGAAHLVSKAAMRMGAGIVHTASPGISSDRSMPTEIVRHALPVLGWAGEVIEESERFQSMVVGPGLGRDDGIAAETRRVISNVHLPMVIDGDGLYCVSWGGEGARDVIRSRPAGTVVTPHDGEFAMVLGDRPSPDRLASARRMAIDLNCVCLLKGPTTVVAEPSGEALVISNADQRLATAGSGDVLAGMIGALLARGVQPFHAAATAAWIHGKAASLFPDAEGLIASDVVDLIPRAVSETVRA